MRLFYILLSAFFLVQPNIGSGTEIYPVVYFQETPLLTAVFKDPAAADPATFFKSSKVYKFWVYKASSPDLNKIINSFKKDKSVMDCNAGAVSGDYTELNLNLKETKNKDWMVSLFKKAGINHIKINNNPVTELSKF